MAARVQLTYEELRDILDALKDSGLVTRSQMKLFKKLSKAIVGMSPTSESELVSSDSSGASSREKQELINKVNLLLMLDAEIDDDDKELYFEYTGVQL